MTESEIGLATAITRQNAGVSRTFSEPGSVKWPAGTSVAEVILTPAMGSLANSAHVAAVAGIVRTITTANLNNVSGRLMSSFARPSVQLPAEGDPFSRGSAALAFNTPCRHAPVLRVYRDLVEPAAEALGASPTLSQKALMAVTAVRRASPGSSLTPRHLVGLPTHL